jgi:hypothetical protein
VLPIFCAGDESKPHATEGALRVVDTAARATGALAAVCTPSGAPARGAQLAATISRRR